MYHLTTTAIDKTGEEIEVEVEFCYYAEEPMVAYYSDGTGYPGSPAEIELVHILKNDKDIFAELDDEEIEDIEKKCWKYLESLNEGDF